MTDHRALEAGDSNANSQKVRLYLRGLGSTELLTLNTTKDRARGFVDKWKAARLYALRLATGKLTKDDPKPDTLEAASLLFWVVGLNAVYLPDIAGIRAMDEPQRPPL